jgi:hypothetical protein
MPRLYILAGPNGTGKTTYYTTALSEIFIEKQFSFLKWKLYLFISTVFKKIEAWELLLVVGTPCCFTYPAYQQRRKIAASPAGWHT